jgi:nucleotide-binding universal stress UspA family protein
MKKILVPTDFSECAENALLVAADIARTTGAEVILLHSVDTPVDWLKLSKEKESNYPETKEKIGNAKSKMNELEKIPELKKLKVSSMIVYNYGHKNIVEHSQKLKTDLIVMGSHGSSGFNEYFIGSNTQKIVRLSGCPVLTVRSKIKRFRIKDIVFASTFEEKVNEPFRHIYKIAKAYNACIHLLFVNTPSDFRESSYMNVVMDDFLLDYPKVKFTKNIYNAFDSGKGIVNFSTTIDADVISLITHGRTRFSMFSTSIAESLVNHSKVPVLSINIL